MKHVKDGGAKSDWAILVGYNCGCNYTAALGSGKIISVTLCSLHEREVQERKLSILNASEARRSQIEVAGLWGKA